MELYIMVGKTTPQWAVFVQTEYGYNQQISPWYTYKKNANKWAIRYAEEHAKSPSCITNHYYRVHNTDYLVKITFDCEGE